MLFRSKIPEALVLVDTLLLARDTLVPWDSLLAAIGRRDPRAASALTDRITLTDGMSALLRARLLVADAIRWRGIDSAQSESRLSSAEQIDEGTPLAGEARLESFRIRIRGVDSIPQLKELSNRIQELGEGVGPVAPSAAQLAGFTNRVALAADSVAPGSPTGDLRLFIAGEMARDSLGAVRFAANQFHRIVREWPGSPFAPKAVLALILLEPSQADSLRQVLQATYPSSPYVEMVENGQSPEFIVLEDSLRRFAAGFRPEGRTAPRPVREIRPGAAPRQPVNR